MRRQPAMQPRADHEAWLRWHGWETVKTVMSLIERADRVVIALPADYNHALNSIVSESETRDDAEEIEADGGIDLLRRIASLRGLQPLRHLANALDDQRISVQLHSPPSIVLERSF